MKKKIITLLALPWILLQFASVAQAAVPNIINYQGYVTDTGGTPIGSGTSVNRKVTFRFWNHASNSTDANRLYSEYQTVTINDGEFSVLIGQATLTGEPNLYGSLPQVFASQDVFLGITVDDGDSIDNEPEISPRQQITTTAYAFRAKVAESVDNLAITNSMIAGGTITADKLAGNSVTTTQLAIGSVTTDDIANDSIGEIQLKNNSVSTAKIQAAAVTGAKIATDTITASNLAADSVSNSKLQINSVYSSNIANGQVSANDLGSGTVSAPETLRIVRGTIDINAAEQGSGWYIQAGEYSSITEIRFSPAFSGTPTVVVSVNEAGEAYHISARWVSSQGFQALRWRMDGTPQPGNWSFIAIGPR